MRIGLYDPHLGTLGGGGRYFLGILEEALRVPGARVTVFSPEPPDRTALARLGVAVDSGDFAWLRGRDPEVTVASGELDLLVAMHSDMPPLSHAARSVAILQFPHRSRGRPRKPLLQALRLGRAGDPLASYDVLIVNSEFTRAYVRARLGVQARIVPPPVDPATATGPKERLILSVGRFFSDWHSKNQHVLAQAMSRLGVQDWRLVLAGGGNDPVYVQQVRRAARDLPVDVRVDVPRGELLELYARASLFWHAAGYGQDAFRRPERLEHFGVATVEAMAHGAVPLVFPAGGSKELVDDGHTGRWWRTPRELVELTQELIADEDERKVMSLAAMVFSRRFSTERFRADIRALVLDV